MYPEWPDVRPTVPDWLMMDANAAAADAHRYKLQQAAGTLMDPFEEFWRDGDGQSHPTSKVWCVLATGEALSREVVKNLCMGSHNLVEKDISTISKFGADNKRAENNWWNCSTAKKKYRCEAIFLKCCNTTRKWYAVRRENGEEKSDFSPIHMKVLFQGQRGLFITCKYT